MDFRKYDRGGDIWDVDRIRKKIKRKRIEKDLEQINNQGFCSKFSSGDRVLYDAGFHLKEAEIIRPIDDSKYEIRVDGEAIVVPADLICEKINLF
jgi:hypothetical protein